MTWADVKRKFVRDHPGAIATREALKAAGITDAEDPWAAAKAMIDEQYTDADTGECLLRRHRETFYRYDQKTHAYVPLSEDTVRVEVTRWLADRIERVTRSKIADTINALAAITTLPADIEPPFLSDVCAKDGYAKADPRRLRRIVLRNGILDMDAVLRGDAIEHAFGPHTARWFTASALPFDFPAAESQAECPRWCLFLDEIFEGDAERRALLQEAFGYCFYPGTNYEAFFVLHGTGRNGKSVCLAVLRSLLGEDNVSSLSPEQLVSQWGLYQIYGKLANICADMNETDRVAEGIIKAVVSGDLVTADRKYLNPIQFRPTCKLWFATNILPRFTDTTLGIWRRMILLPFNYTVPPEKIDPDLFATLREELPGIFLWTIRGLVRLCNNRRFSEATSCAEAVTAYRRNCFPILTFLEECTDRGPDLYVQAGDLWTAYKRWGEAVGLSHLKRLHEFLRDIALFVPESKAKKYTAFEARSVLCGIGLRADLDALGAATRAIPFQQNVFDSQEDTRP
jgi:P4 family phage/plasmid primase-like protien